MTASLGKICADFNTTLNLKVAVAATSATLDSATDDDWVALPTWTYFLTIDGDSIASKEYIKCTLTSTALTSIQSVSRQGALTSGFARTHRKGATVTITDFAIIKKMLDLLDGTTDFDSATVLWYDAAPTLTTGSNEFATVKYADDLAIAGSPDATIATKGITTMSVAPASAATPIAVGDNDPRVPTQDENNALAGTSGTPSSSNKYVTNDDTAVAATANEVARRWATGNVTVITEAAWTSSTEAASTAFATTASNKKVNITTTDVTVANTTTETNLLSVAIPANTLGTNNWVRARLFISTSLNQGSDVFALKFKYWTTTIATLSSVDGQNIDLNWYIECYLFGSGATNTQEGNMLVELFQDNVDGTAVAGSRIRNFLTGTAAEDSTWALNLIVTIQYSGAGAPSANDTITVSQIVVEKIN